MRTTVILHFRLQLTVCYARVEQNPGRVPEQILVLPRVLLLVMCCKLTQCTGKYYFEATVTDEGLCRVGWSTKVCYCVNCVSRFVCCLFKLL